MADLSGSPTADSGTGSRLLNLVRRLRRSAGFAWRGLVLAWQNEPNLRLEVLIAALAGLLAVWLGTGLVAVLLATVLVVALELVNSSVEALVDLVSPGEHPLAGAAKDMSAAAVLVASLGAAGVGLIAMGPALLERLGLR